MSKQFTPPQLEAMLKFDTPTISNAVEGCGVRSPVEGYAGHALRCFTPERGVMAGYAITATIDNATPEKRSDAKGIKAFYQALAAAPKPAVVVFRDVSGRPTHSCHFGDIVSLMCKQLGAVGMVSNGGFRDLAGIRDVGMHVFATGTVASRGRYQWVDVNVPVDICGLSINPGDLLHGDANGLISIPQEASDGLMEQAEAVRQKEQGLLDFARSEGFSLEALLERLG